MYSDGHVEDYDSSDGPLAVIKVGGDWWDKGDVSGTIENGKVYGGSVGLVGGHSAWEDKVGPYAGLLGLKMGAKIYEKGIPW